MTCAMGISSKLIVEPGEDAPTYDASSEIYEIVSESLQKNETQIDASGITGTRSRAQESIVEGSYDVTGSVVINPSVSDLQNWLPRILGSTAQSTPVTYYPDLLKDNSTAASGTDTYVPQDNFYIDGPLSGSTTYVGVFNVLVDRAATGGTQPTFDYRHCLINRAILRGSVNDVISLELEIIGKSEAWNSTGYTTPTFPAVPTEVDRPYVFHQAALKYNNVDIEMESFELVIDNVLETRFGTSQEATCIRSTDRIVTLSVDAHWDTTSAPTYDIAATTGGQAENYLFLTGTSVSTKIYFGTLIQSAQAPTVANKSFIGWPLVLEARRDADGGDNGGTGTEGEKAEICIENDHTV